MNYTLTILEKHYNQLIDSIYSKPGLEGAAYLLCGESLTTGELRILVNEVVPVEIKDYLERKEKDLLISSSSYTKIAKKARINNQSIIFVHSHLDKDSSFSSQDNVEEAKLQKFFKDRIPSKTNGALVFNTKYSFSGRVWVDKKYQVIRRVRIIGQQFKFIDLEDKEKIIIPEFFARQVLVFGPEMQSALGRLHIGIVGAGGTGSAVAEQLTRLGIGELSIFDGDKFENSNISRLYGSNITQKGQNKAKIVARNIRRIGLRTRMHVYQKNINNKLVAKNLRKCDLIFGCTDKEWPRAALTQLGIRYLIPLIDLGVSINSNNGIIQDIIGRITTFFPGEACLFCRKRIDSRRIQLETLSLDERKSLAIQHYAPELETDDPAVITFTTTVASQAINEFLQRLTMFMSEVRFSSEVLIQFNQTRIRTNRNDVSKDCLCQNIKNWGKGDSRDYLGMTWTR